MNLPEPLAPDSTCAPARAHVQTPSEAVAERDVRAAPLHARGLAYTYPHAHATVFEDIALHARAGSLLAVLGNNGSGKSTLLSLLVGNVRSMHGEVEVCGSPLEGLSRRQAARWLAFVSQQQCAPHLSVYDQVLLGRRPYLSWSVTERDRTVVAHCIERLGLEGFAQRFCDELSGGERQKAYIARALAQEPNVLLLDEPTSALDPKNQIEVMRAVRDITVHEDIATVVVMHDINLALRFCDRFMLMRDGNIVVEGAREAVTPETLERTFDIAFHLVEVAGETIALPSQDLPL